MFYTSVVQSNNSIHHFFREGLNKYIQTDDKFRPSGFIDDDNGEYKDIRSGNKVREYKFGNIFSFYRFDRDTRRLYNDISPKYQFIRSVYPNESIDYNFRFIKWANLDIENPVPKHLGFPDPEEAKHDIKTITLFVTQDFKTVKYVFGLYNYKVKDDEVVYIKCFDERDLLSKFIDVWISEYPDIITGWNIDNFDIPYLIKRLSMYGLQNSLSPIGVVKIQPNLMYEKLRKMTKSGFRYNPKFRCSIGGVEILDYYWMYRKFKSNNMESFRLDFIGNFELGMTKLDYKSDGYKDLFDLYEKDFQKFVDYNIRDVEIVNGLENKLRYLDLMVSFAYLAKVNFSDVFSPVKCWESFLFNILSRHGYVLPYRRSGMGGEYVGAWTMPRTAEFFEWILAHDLDSLYPHIIMQYNMSYECKIGYIHEFFDIGHPLNINQVDERLIGKKLDLKMLKEKNLTMAGSGLLFDRSKKGIIVQILSDIYADRKNIKKELGILQQKYEDTGDTQLLPEIASKNSKQNAIKVFLNSYYGIMGNESFILYDVDMALAVTLSAQLSIRWIINYAQKNVDPKFGFKIIYGDTDSVTGSARVTIMDSNESIVEMPISELFCMIKENCEIKDLDGCRVVLKPNFDLSILGYDGKNRKPTFRRLNYIMMKNNVKELYRVMHGNKSVLMTGDHSLIVEDSDGRIIDVTPADMHNMEDYKLIIYN